MADEHSIKICSEKVSLEQNLTLPTGIATNMEGNFIVADIMKAKVFNNSGDYLHSLCLPNDDKVLCNTVDVDTDKDGKVYLLVWMALDLQDKPDKEQWYKVFVFDKDGMLHSKFPLRAESRGRKLAVLTQDDKTEVLVLERGRGLHDIVEVYGTDGKFVGQFGEGTLMDAQDIVAANKGHVYVLDNFHESQGKCVHEFTAERKHLGSFGVDPNSVSITFDWGSERIVIVSSRYDPEETGFLQNVSIYENSNAIPDNYIGRKLLRSYELDTVKILLDASITATTEGLIAVVLAEDFHGKPRGKLIVMEEATIL